MKKILRFFLKAIKWTVLGLIGLLIISSLYNLTLPKKSKIVEYLSAVEKAYISEAMNLHQSLGSEIWPGWGDMHIPVITYNEEYAFLIDFPNPPAGWYKMPNEELRGMKWEAVPTDKFEGKTYYRQALPNPEEIPENFTVKVGDRWLASMQTKEYAAIAFYSGFNEELPPVIKAIFPYKIFWKLLMGDAENYICGILHESFHAFQGKKAPDRLSDSEYASRLSSDYPWNDTINSKGWIEETNLLAQAYHTKDEELAKQLVAQFSEKRMARRINANLPIEMIQYEQKREWLEGLAKYAELEIGLIAGERKDYYTTDGMEKISGFKNYKTFPAYYDQQIEEVKRAANRHGESRFYYGGMLQAKLLDRFIPDWKMNAFDNQVYLDDLLEKLFSN